jgi:hypothetical protein
MMIERLLLPAVSTDVGGGGDDHDHKTANHSNAGYHKTTTLQKTYLAQSEGINQEVGRSEQMVSYTNENVFA